MVKQGLLFAIIILLASSVAASDSFTVMQFFETGIRLLGTFILGVIDSGWLPIIFFWAAMILIVLMAILSLPAILFFIYLNWMKRKVKG